MYNGISLNFNAWTEPTRSVISYPPALEKASVLMNTDVGVLDNPEKALASSTSYIADTTDPYLAKATDLLYNQGEEYDKTKDAKTGFSKAVDKAFDNAKKAFGILTEEETMCGVVPNVAQIPFYPLSFASKEIQASLANFVHSMAKFSNRSCTVNCCLIDDMAVGMPVLLVDDVFSIHGILENYTYSVTPDGQIGCQASIAYPKMIFNGMDTIPQPPVWINSDNISVENIGSKVYSGLFGCNSMYDDEEVTFDNVNEITYKTAKITAAVINRYNKAADKLLFVNDYRMRASNISMEDYFKNILNCEPEFQAWDATAVKVWKAKSGEDGIFAVYNGGNGRASIGEAGDTVDGTVTLQHTAVDKQQMVLNYVNAVYRGTVSGIIGGMLVDGERDDDLIVTVRDDIPDVVEQYSPVNSATMQSNVPIESSSLKAPTRAYGAESIADSEKMAKIGSKNFTREQFIDCIGETCSNDMQRTGIPASVTIAQAILESRNGNSLLSKSDKNLFGVKAFDRNGSAGYATHLTTEEDSSGRKYQVYANFRKYATATDSIADHSRVLNGSRYQKAKAAYHNAIASGSSKAEASYIYAQGIADAGYATDSTYASQLTGLIRKYKLYEYDK
jgi:flagellum-specific peptidoglycan hydrolase FlgJ